MKQAQPNTKPRKPAKSKQPDVLTPQVLTERVEFLRVFLAELDGYARTLKDGGVESITLAVGHGSESYELTVKALNAWVKGVRKALLAKKKPSNSEPPPEGPTA